MKRKRRKRFSRFIINCMYQRNYRKQTQTRIFRSNIAGCKIPGIFRGRRTKVLIGSTRKITASYEPQDRRSWCATANEGQNETSLRVVSRAATRTTFAVDTYSDFHVISGQADFHHLPRQSSVYATVTLIPDGNFTWMNNFTLMENLLFDLGSVIFIGTI